MKTKLFVMLFVLVAVVMAFASCGHECDYSVVLEEVAATCTTNGYKTTQCSQCELTKTEALTATGHAYTEVITAPTCKAEGFTTKTCSNCGEAQTINRTSKLQHSYTIKMENTRQEPTCTEKGYVEKLMCSICNEATRWGEEIPTTGHKFKEVRTYKVEPDCERSGKGDIVNKCEICGFLNPDVAPVYDKEIPAFGHDIPAEPQITPATCLTAQVNTWACQREGCGYSKVEQDPDHPALQHDYSVKAEVIIPATCYSLETANFKCARCDEKVPQQIPDSYVPHEKGAEAGCSTHQICKLCFDGDRKEPNIVDGEGGCDMTNDMCVACVKKGKAHVFALPTEKHTYDLANPVEGSTVAPTCMQKGYSMYKCSECEGEYPGNYTEIDPENHKYDYENMIGDTTTPATCIRFEFSTHKCIHEDEAGNICGKTIDKTVGDKYADHSFDSKSSPAGVATCKVCSKSYYDTTYVENKFVDSEGKKWDNESVIFDESVDEDGNPVDVTLGVTILTSTKVKDALVLNSTTTSATVVDTENLDTTFITVIRFYNTVENSATKYKVTVNGEKTYEITGSSFVDLHLYIFGEDMKEGTADDVKITSLSVEIVEGTDEATVCFYGRDPISAPEAGGSTTTTPVE